MLASCAGESSSSSHFVPPSETSSSSSESTSDTSSSVSQDAENKANEIISKQSFLTEKYQDYAMTGEFLDEGETTTSSYVYSPKYGFYAAKHTVGGTYLVTIDGVDTLIIDTGAGATSFTEEWAIALSSTAFETIGLMKELSITLLEQAFAEETILVINDYSIEDDGRFIIELDVGDSFPFPSNVVLTFNSDATPSTMKMNVIEGTYAGDYLSYSFRYGTSETDRQYPSI